MKLDVLRKICEPIEVNKAKSFEFSPEFSDAKITLSNANKSIQNNKV